MSTNVSRKKRRKKRRRGKKLLVLLVVLAVMATVLYALSVTVLFKIKTVEIAGSSRYDVESITSLSGIVIGDNLIRMNPSEVSDKLSKALPYLGEVKVERKFPDNVRITVSECTPDTAYEFENGYIIACGEKCLELNQEKPEGLVTVKADLTEFVAGFPVKISADAGSAISKLRAAAQDAGVTGIVSIDVSNVSDISFVCDNLIRLRIGTTDNLEKKMNNAVSIIKTQRSKYGDNVEGTIDLRYLSNDSNLSYFTRESISSTVELEPSDSDQNIQTSSQITSETSSTLS